MPPALEVLIRERPITTALDKLRVFSNTAIRALVDVVPAG